MFPPTLFSVMTPAHCSSVQSFGGMFSDYFQSGRRKSLKLVCFNIRWRSGAGSPHSKRASGSNPSWGLSAWSLHILLVSAWVLFGCTSEMCMLGCRCKCERGCLIASVCQLCDRLTTWLVHAPPLAGVRFINPKSSKLQQHFTILTMLKIRIRDFRHSTHV